MAVTMVLFGVVYVSLVVFLLASIARGYKYAHAPIHLRWELYPVPHEESSRVEHGGSYFETSDWWEKPAHFNLMGELSFMVPEMLFLKALWEFNRKLWYRSFPFHFGLYLLIGASGLVLVNAVVGLAWPAVAAGAIGLGLRWLYIATGVIGMTLAMVGALGLLHRRLTDQTLKLYTTPGDIFNLLFFLVAFGVLTLGLLTRGPGTLGPVGLVQSLLTFDTTAAVPATLGVGLLLSALLVAYIPLTHMSHFIGKYFTYHAVRWADERNVKGGRMEEKLMEYLTYKPTWAAPHIAGDGVKTWADVATTNPTEGVKK